MLCTGNLFAIASLALVALGLFAVQVAKNWNIVGWLSAGACCVSYMFPLGDALLRS